MKTAIIYYSKTGNTQKIAEYIKNKIQQKQENGEIKIIEIKPYTTPGFLKSVWYALTEKERPIKNEKINFKPYDLIIIGSPVWAGRPAPFIKTFINQSENIQDKKGAVFVTCRKNKSAYSTAIPKIKKILKNNNMELIPTHLAIEMTKDGETKKGQEKIGEYINKIIEK